MQRADARAWSLRAASLAFVLGACNQVLGIEPASIDPRLSVAGGPAGNAHAGSGTGGSSVAPGSGSSGMGGTAGTGAAPASGGTDTSGHEHPASGGSTPAGGGEAGEGASAPSTGGSSGKGMQGGSGHGGKSSNAEAGAAGETSGPTDLCDEYCSTMDTGCVGNDAQYRDHEQCEKICHLLPEGTVGAADDDSIACRLKYVQKTRYANGSELSVYCRQAGPSGNGSCGSVCEAYCTLMAEVCTADTAGIYHFASDGDCMKTCDALPAAPVPYSSSDPQVSDGNHALCRLFHVTSAAMADADEHCEHAMGVTLCEAPAQ
jgi:hypothetical protein